MSFFDFGPKPTTITTTFTPLGGRPFTTTLTTHGGIIPTGSIPFPNFNDFLLGVSDNDCGVAGKVIPPGLGGSGPPGLDHHGDPLCPGSPGPTPNPSPGSPPLNPSSTASTTDSSGTSSSQSSQESVSTTTEHSAVTSSTRGSDQPPKSTDTTTGGFTATSSSEGSSTSTSTSASVVVVVSSYPSLPAESLPTSTSVSTSTQSSPATAAVSSASGLSAGSAVGIALGAFVAAILLVVAALFLFLRQRKRRRDRYAAKRKLRWSEGGRSRALSSIWSWFGSLPIGSEFDTGSAQEHKDARRRASQRLDGSEDPFQDVESNSDKSATMVAHGALSHPAASTVHVHEGVEQAHASPSQSGHEREGMEGAARLLALAATDYSASGALPFSSYSNPAASGPRAGHVPPDGHQIMSDSERGRTRVQEARDPFADPGRPLSGFSQTLTVASSTEVQSVEAQ